MRVVIHAEVSGHVRNATVEVKSSDTVADIVEKYAKSIKRKSPFRGGEPVLFSGSGAELDPSEELGNLNIREGTTLFLRVKSRKEAASRCCKCCLVLSFLALFAFAGGVLAVVLLQEFWDSGSKSHLYQYGIVIDAGSSHTSLRVYRWPGDKKNDTGLVKQHKSTCHSNGGAISQYISDPSQAGPSLKGCLDIAKDIVPQNKQNATPIFLGATAGMRILNEMNTTAAMAIMHSVQSFIATYPFAFKPEQASIISGKVEGIGGWITINYLLGNLVPSSVISHVMTAVGLHDSSTLSGALDLGGASEQVTFVPHTAPLEDGVNLRLYGQNYTVYTHSYLCYGRNEANRQLLAQLVKASNYATQVTNPCAQKGYQVKVPSSDIFKPPCVPTSSDMATMPETFSFSGSGDIAACQTHVIALFNVSVCPTQPCGFNGVYQPVPVGPFNAFSGFADAAAYLNITQATDLSQWQEAANRTCSLSWREVEDKDFPDDSLKNISCFLAQYIYYDLTTGLHIAGNGGPVDFSDHIEGSHLGWTLGFMINATNMLPTEMPTHHRLMSTILFAELVSVFGFLCFITTFSLLVWCLQRKCHNRHGYVTLKDFA